MMRLLSILLLLFVTSGTLSAQSVKQLLRDGNNMFEDGSFDDAEASYRKGIAADVESEDRSKGMFNLGDAIYMQEDRYEDAISAFEQAAEGLTLAPLKAAAYHNIGNAYMSMEEWEKSIEAYKSALKLYPEDMDTKYNLAYAQLHLQQEQQQQGGEGQQEQQEQEGEEEQESEQNEQEEGDQEQEGDQGEEGEQDESENGESESNQDSSENGEEEGETPQPQQLSKEEAERLLKAIQGEEDKVKDKMDKKKVQVVETESGKDW